MVYLDVIITRNIFYKKGQSCLVLNGTGTRSGDHRTALTRKLILEGTLRTYGIRGKAVTSLNVELGVEKVDEEEVKAKILKHFSQLFEAEFVTK